eukprot:3318703-Pyramimonas_sp.AAC.1
MCGSATAFPCAWGASKLTAAAAVRAELVDCRCRSSIFPQADPGCSSCSPPICMRRGNVNLRFGGYGMLSPTRSDLTMTVRSSRPGHVPSIDFDVPS